MKYLKQMFIILACSLAGEALSWWIPLPVPGAIYGFVLLFLALCTGLLKEEHIADTADFLIAVMPAFFVSPAVNLLAHYKLIAGNLIPIVTIVLVSTFLVFGVAGLMTKALRKKEDKNA